MSYSDLTRPAEPPPGNALLIPASARRQLVAVKFDLRQTAPQAGALMTTYQTAQVATCRTFPRHSLAHRRHCAQRSDAQRQSTLRFTDVEESCILEKVHLSVCGVNLAVQVSWDNNRGPHCEL